MCIVGENRVRDELNATARRVATQLSDVPEYASTISTLRDLLESSSPVIRRALAPVPQQLSAAELLERPVQTYPALLEDCLGPPLRIGPDPLLGYVSAQCALAALRHNDVQAALAALVLTSLTAVQLEPPALEALHHLLLEADPGEVFGLLTLPALRAGTSSADLTALRKRQQLRFLTTAVQVLGAFA